MSVYEYETVLSALTSPGVRTITFNRPQRLNAMNQQLVVDTASAFRDANADSETSVIILTGAGRAFCAGDDRREHEHFETEGQARKFIDTIQDATREIVFGPKPVVGAINGWAVGGGFEWAIDCDFPIWGESAVGFFPEVTLNVFVTGGVTSLLPALVGLNAAREMLYFGDRYDAEALRELGVAWRVVDDGDLLEEAHAVASRLAELPSLAAQAMKRVLNESAVADLHAAIDRETEAAVTGFLDPESTRRLKAFES